MRRRGATCTAAQTHMHSQRISSQEYDQNGAESGGGDALPSEWRRCASQRPIASITAGGSARFRLLTCGRSFQHAKSAKIGAIFWPHERQAPIIRPATEGGDCEAGRLADQGKGGGRRYVWVPRRAVFAQMIRRDGSRQLPANTGCRQGGEGRGHGTSHNYPAKALRVVGRGFGQAERLARTFQLSTTTKKEGR